jgi:hypothetical protein
MANVSSARTSLANASSLCEFAVSDEIATNECAFTRAQLQTMMTCRASD